MKQSTITLPNGKGEIVVVGVEKWIDLNEEEHGSAIWVSCHEAIETQYGNNGKSDLPNYEILGVIENGKVGFECESLVESCVLVPIDMSGNKIGEPTEPDWYDYDKAKWFVLNSAEDSFLSLLKSQGIEVDQWEKMLVLKVKK